MDYRNIIDALDAHAEERPKARAQTLLGPKVQLEEVATFSDLAERSRAIAAELVSRFEPTSRIIVSYPAGIELTAAFIGCLRARMIAVPCPPITEERLQRTAERIDKIIEDAGPVAVLTSSRQLTLRKRLSGTKLGQLHWVGTDRIHENRGADLPRQFVLPSDTAYLQYTSGSTSSPKGVIVTHENLRVFCEALIEARNYTQSAVTVTWMPYFHDYGLVAGRLVPLWQGIPCHQMEPQTFVSRPQDWLQAITKYKATHSEGPDFAYALCVRRIPDEDKKHLDLSSWRVASCGAEPIHWDTVDRFCKTYVPYRFDPHALSPAYGLAEATLTVSTSRPGVMPSRLRLDASALAEGRVVETTSLDPEVLRPVVSCGPPIAIADVAIVDDENKRLGDGNIGHVRVSSRQVAGGYWGLPTESKTTFETRIDGDEGSWLDTGDLGFLHGGELYITGRSKDLIIVGGQNHYPTDIERTVAHCHDMLRMGAVAAFPVVTDARERVGIVAEVRTDVLADGAEDIADHIRRAVADVHALSVQTVGLIRRGTIPKTTSGKVRRSACKSELHAKTLELVHISHIEADPQGLNLGPRSDIESKLIEIWQSALNIEAVGARDDFFDLGGTSLVAGRVIAAVNSSFGVNLPFAQVVQTPTIETLAQHLQRGGKDDAASIAVSTNAPGRPLFGIPGVYGHAFFYRSLAAALGAERTLYSLARPGKAGTAPVGDMEGAAAHFVDLIVRAQPDGPYALCGYSAGGVFAYAVAATLRRRGATVELLALFDSVAPTVEPDPVSRSLFHIGNIARAGVGGLDYLRRKLENRIDKEVVGQEPDRDVRESMRRALRNYRIPTYVGSVTLFQAEERTDWLGPNTTAQYNGWSPYVRGPIEVISVPGDHQDMSGDSLPALARELAKVLSKSS